MHFYFVWFLISIIFGSESSKIMITPADHKSHVLNFARLGERLAKDGHEVYILASSKHLSILKNIKGINQDYIFDAKSNFSTELIFKEILEGSPFNIIKMANLAQLFKEHMNIILGQVINPQESMWKQLQAANFDLFIVDGFEVVRGLLSIPYLLKVPYIAISPRPNPWKSGVPVFPSEPYFSLSVLNENSSIFSRLTTLLGYAFIDNIFELLQPSISEIMNKFHPDRQHVNLDQLYKGSEMIFINQQVICLDFQRSEMPHYQYIQGLANHQPNSLSRKFQKIAHLATNGMIIISFGSAVPSVPESILEMIVFAAENLPSITFIMRHRGKEDFPPNLNAFPWIPQNDLLAHPNSKVFLTHGGNNGQVEAVNHGVPQLVIPIADDQFYNGWRAEMHGIGIVFYREGNSKEDFYKLLNLLLDDPKYMERAKKCSAIVKSLPSGQDKVAFWVNHVLKFGGDHLKPYSIKLPLYKLLMLDIFFFISIPSILICILAFKCCSKLCKKTQLHPKTD